MQIGAIRIGKTLKTLGLDYQIHHINISYFDAGGKSL